MLISKYKPHGLCFFPNLLIWFNILVIFVFSYGLVKSYDMPCTVESVSLEPKFGNKFVAGGEDMWVHVFDFHTGNEIGELLTISSLILYCVYVVLMINLCGSMQQGAPWSCPLCSFFSWWRILCLWIWGWNHQNMADWPIDSRWLGGFVCKWINW